MDGFRQISREEACSFFRMCTPGGAQEQLHGLISARAENLALWLEAACDTGIFDYRHPEDGDKQSYLSTAQNYLALSKLITAQGVAGGNDPQVHMALQMIESVDRLQGRATSASPEGQKGREELEQFMFSERLRSHKGFCPPGLAQALDRIYEALRGSYEEWRQIRMVSPGCEHDTAADPGNWGGVKDPCVNERLGRYLKTIAACAAAIDHAPLFSRILALRPVREDPYIERSVLGTRPALMIHNQMRLHLAIVAMHFGANACVQEALDGGWRPASDAGRLYANSGCKGDSEPLRLTELLPSSTNTIALQPSTLAMVYAHMEAGGELDNQDRHRLVELMLKLEDDCADRDDWASKILATGIHFADIHESMAMACRNALLPLIDDLAPQIDWTQPVRTEGGSHFALEVHDFNGDRCLDPQHQHAALTRLIDLVAASGPEAIERMLGAHNSASDATLAQQLVEMKFHDLLTRLLDLGLDPDKRPSHQNNSLLEWSSLRGWEQAEAILRSWQARKVAGEELRRMTACPERRV